MTKKEVNLLVNEAQGGSQKAFTKLYNLFYNNISNSLYFIVKNRDVADDLASETFTKAFIKIHQFSLEISFEMWLRTIANNCAIDFIRRQKNNSASNYTVDIDISECDSTDNSSPESIFITKENKDIISKKINSLTGRSKEVVVLRYIEGLSYKEIAERLNLNIGTIKSYISKSTKKIKPN